MYVVVPCRVVCRFSSIFFFFFRFLCRSVCLQFALSTFRFHTFIIGRINSQFNETSFHQCSSQQLKLNCSLLFFFFVHECCLLLTKMSFIGFSFLFSNEIHKSYYIIFILFSFRLIWLSSGARALPPVHTTNPYRTRLLSISQIFFRINSSWIQDKQQFEMQTM